ncbi:MAG: NAD(P)/FAD-dependent oxidoreductase [bacterium]|nr:NAD(P)/FAD-dependent oxidoreductase [bacterium]
MDRRDFIKLSSAAGLTFFLNFNAFPAKLVSKLGKDEYDAIVLGAGLGGLTFAAAMARQGYKPLVLERREAPGGYATCLRKDGFTFDFSLRATSARERDGIINMIPVFPEITEVEYVRYTNFYRAQFPDLKVSVESGNIKKYISQLTSLFPNEKEGIEKLFNAIENNVNEFATLTWEKMMGTFISDKRLKGLLSAIWIYLGLPPSSVSATTYVRPIFGFLKHGTYYPKGGSQSVANAFMNYIQSKGGKVLLNEEVNKLEVKNNAVTEVITKSGRKFSGGAIVSNINPFTVFSNMVSGNYDSYLAKLHSLQPSISVFEVFLGTDKDLITENGITDFQIFAETDYDIQKGYKHSMAGNMEQCSLLITMYDTIIPDYSPKGKNTISLIVAQDFSLWENLSTDELKAKTQAFKTTLIKRAEQCGLKGLSKHIEVEEVFTPLNCLEISNSYRGAIYGWAASPDNPRIPQATPIKNLFLSGAWTLPGHGQIGVMVSGLDCFKKVMAILPSK